MTNMEVDEVESSGSDEEVKVDFIESARLLAGNTVKLRENAFKALQKDLFSRFKNSHVIDFYPYKLLFNSLRQAIASRNFSACGRKTSLNLT